MKKLLQTTGLAALLIFSYGCGSKAGTGALVGGAGGAVVGGVVGGGSGALAGGAIGLVGGAVIGAAMDESDRRNMDQQTQDQLDSTDQMTPKLLVKMHKAGVSKKSMRKMIYSSKPITPNRQNMDYIARNGVPEDIQADVKTRYRQYHGNSE